MSSAMSPQLQGSAHPGLEQVIRKNVREGMRDSAHENSRILLEGYEPYL